eukprot:1893817-Amphidinium_carterae.1
MPWTDIRTTRFIIDGVDPDAAPSGGPGDPAQEGNDLGRAGPPRVELSQGCSLHWVPGWPVPWDKDLRACETLGPFSSPRTESLGLQQLADSVTYLAKRWTFHGQEKSLSPFGPWLNTQAPEEPGLEWPKNNLSLVSRLRKPVFSMSWWCVTCVRTCYPVRTYTAALLDRPHLRNFAPGAWASWTWRRLTMTFTRDHCLGV